MATATVTAASPPHPAAIHTLPTTNHQHLPTDQRYALPCPAADMSRAARYAYGYDAIRTCARLLSRRGLDHAWTHVCGRVYRRERHHTTQRVCYILPRPIALGAAAVQLQPAECAADLDAALRAAQVRTILVLLDRMYS
jgi:hypothetical protein